MPEVSEPSPNARRIRWALWTVALLLTVVAGLDAVRQHWLGAAQTMLMACICALFPSIYEDNATKSQQTRYLAVLLATLALGLWDLVTNVL